MTSPSDNLLERPTPTGRICTVCTAEVAAFEDALLCHCATMPWVIEASNDLVGEMEEALSAKIAQYVDMQERDDLTEYGEGGLAALNALKTEFATLSRIRDDRKLNKEGVKK